MIVPSTPLVQLQGEDRIQVPFLDPTFAETLFPLACHSRFDVATEWFRLNQHIAAIDIP